jgi:enoyl-CoA hydratase/carnithine racemase
MVFTGERVDAETALRINLTTEVVEDPRGRAMELAGQIAEYPLDALWMAKQGLKDIYELPLSAALRAERQRIFPLYVRQHQEDE